MYSTDPMGSSRLDQVPAASSIAASLPSTGVWMMSANAASGVRQAITATLPPQ